MLRAGFKVMSKRMLERRSSVSRKVFVVVVVEEFVDEVNEVLE
jgi:hypothetical protein